MGAGFAYLFERFPSFTQTFCFREVLEMRRQGVDAPVFSIRKPDGEPGQDFPSELDGLVTYLPPGYDEILSRDASFRRKARKALVSLRNLWGDETEKRRIYEALWLIPRLNEMGVGHVHAHFAGTASRTAFWLNQLDGVRYSITAHANDIFCDEPPQRLRMMFEKAGCIVTVSDFSAEMLRRQFPNAAAKVHRVYNGIDVERFQSDGCANSRPLIVAIGRYIEKKGFADLIAACALLSNVDFECRIIGDGPLDGELKNAVVASGLEGRVSITGPKPEQEVIAALSSASMFVLPCVADAGGGMDNLPTVIMEAMAAGVPVISTRLAGVPEMVEDGVTGILVEPGDRDALARAMGRLLERPDLARQMGDGGRTRCRERFSTAVTTSALHALLENAGAFPERKRSMMDRFLGK